MEAAQQRESLFRSSPFKLHTWLLGDTAAGNMSVSAPATATTGSTGTITLNFSSLSSGVKYLGSVVYGGAAGMPNPTIVHPEVSKDLSLSKGPSILRYRRT